MRLARRAFTRDHYPRADPRHRAREGRHREDRDIRHLVAGSENRRVLQDGVMDAAAWSCGTVAGLIHDIPPCKELIDRIMQGAEEIISRRLEGLLAA